jgi:hypothetical protein
MNTYAFNVVVGVFDVVALMLLVIVEASVKLCARAR